ncbi:MAG: hypothetical protein HUU02_00500 [Bacteroidetes bacterium]|nr:hypothetical protein [Bacteroidota bacterium]
MRLKFFLVLVLAFFCLSSEFALSQDSIEEIPIAGVWTCDRPPYGIDTLIISGDRIVLSFVVEVGGQSRHIYGRVIKSVAEKSQLAYEIYKVIEGNVVVPSAPEHRFMVYEVAETELWTYTDSGAFPDRAFLKANAYRSAWRTKDIQPYLVRFYESSSSACIDSVLYSIYDHRGVTRGSSYVTIPPKFIGGVQAYDAYFQQGFNRQESLDGIFGIVSVSCTITCNGSVSNVEVAEGRMSVLLPKTLELLMKLVSGMPNWIPALSDYRKVPCRIEIPFVISDGRLRAGRPR